MSERANNRVETMQRLNQAAAARLLNTTPRRLRDDPREPRNTDGTYDAAALVAYATKAARGVCAGRLGPIRDGSTYYLAIGAQAHYCRAISEPLNIGDDGTGIAMLLPGSNGGANQPHPPRIAPSSSASAASNPASARRPSPCRRCGARAAAPARSRSTKRFRAVTARRCGITNAPPVASRSPRATFEVFPTSRNPVRGVL